MQGQERDQIKHTDARVRTSQKMRDGDVCVVISSTASKESYLMLPCECAFALFDNCALHALHAYGHSMPYMPLTPTTIRLALINLDCSFSFNSFHWPDQASGATHQSSL
jgi:hypothetical protein